MARRPIGRTAISAPTPRCIRGKIGPRLGPLSARGRQPRHRPRIRLRGEDVEQAVEPFGVDDLYDPTTPNAHRVILLINSWVQLTTVVNELARGMGQHDFYPFVMSRPVLRKMHFIQMIVKEARGGAH